MRIPRLLNLQAGLYVDYLPFYWNVNLFILGVAGILRFIEVPIEINQLIKIGLVEVCKNFEWDIINLID